ncbi:MAG: hypothetical protein AAF628_36650 [Planctomycetota bacterium]
MRVTLVLTIALAALVLLGCAGVADTTAEPVAVVGNPNDGNRSGPEPGYEWMPDGISTRWAPGKAHPIHPHIIAGPLPGEWISESGYHRTGEGKDYGVRWVPGIKHRAKHLVSAPQPGVWVPENGYVIDGGTAADPKVRKATRAERLLAEQFGTAADRNRATLHAWNHHVRIANSLKIGSATLTGELADAISREYRRIDTGRVDARLAVWVRGIVGAADHVADVCRREGTATSYVAEKGARRFGEQVAGGVAESVFTNGLSWKSVGQGLGRGLGWGVVAVGATVVEDYLFDGGADRSFSRDRASAEQRFWALWSRNSSLLVDLQASYGYVVH